MTYYGYSNKSTKMNDWIRMILKDPKFGLLVTDLDFIFYDYKKKRMKLIEVKTFNATMKRWQRELFAIINKALENQTQDIEYEGFFLIQLDKEHPEESTQMKINNIEVTKQQLIDFLNFDIRFNELETS